MLTKNINFKNFLLKKSTRNIKIDLNSFLKENNEILKSLTPNYKNSYKKKDITKLKNFLDISVIGMGGSILGTKAIYDFLQHKIKKNFTFISDLKLKKKNYH